MFNTNYMKIVFLFLLTFLPAASLACSATPPGYISPTTADKIKGSSHIIIGKRHLEGWGNIFGTPAYNHETGEPSTAKIEVLHVLKGKIDKEIITVSTSFGMCGYAFLFYDDEPHILLLSDPHINDLAYHPNGGYISSPEIGLYKNEETGVYEVYEHFDQHSDAIAIPIENFIKKHNLKPQSEPLNNR